MDFYKETKERSLEALRSRPEGLSAAEAEKRLAEHGANKLAEGKRRSLFSRFMSQLADPMIIVLLGAAVLSAISSAYAGESFADVFIILFVVVLNSVLGVVQENKAEGAIDALKKMTAPTSKVMRDGVLTVVKSEELVSGDIIVLEAGDSVPADARIIDCASLKAEESALTGESVPSEKSDLPGEEGAPLGDRHSMLYMGSAVVYGRGTAVVTETGMNTEMGRIAGALSAAADESTPLQKKLASLSKMLTFLVLGICVVMFVTGIIRAGSFSSAVMIDTFMMAVSLAVAAIPEGLAAVVTIVLSMGVTKMSARGAVIRRLTAVETLGCAGVICSDKTGTLTQNKMTVTKTATADETLLARAMSLCSDAADGENGAVGEPTECALVNYATSLGMSKTSLIEKYPRVAEAPFDSERKMMTTVHSTDKGFVQFTKGAPDVVLSRCTMALTADGIVPMTEKMRREIMGENKSMADMALRVLAAAMRAHETLPADQSPEALEAELVYVGLCGMIDPVRPEVKEAVQRCREAGIRPIMITGDHIDTAAAIGRELGILAEGDEAVPGSSLDSMSDEELERAAEHISVYARVRPEHKVRIVEAWRRRGMICAMTGDGVNDAPSIKAADIGIGMGITGTDVTKNVADMILADDNFATIVSAVEEGRRIYANIRRSIQFLLSSNLSEVIAVFAATLMGFSVLKPVHMLWINLITDSLPALALGVERGEEDSMKKPPRDPRDGIFAGGMGVDTLYQGALVALLTLAAYFIGHRMESGLWEIAGSPDGVTMAFLTLSMAEIFQSFNMRSRRGSIFTMKSQNKLLWLSAAGAMILTAAVIFIPPLANAFGFTPISPMEYVTALGLALLVIPVVEIVKFIQRAAAKKK